jgi:hypothetical protein
VVCTVIGDMSARILPDWPEPLAPALFGRVARRRFLGAVVAMMLAGFIGAQVDEAFRHSVPTR